ncbi:hypothetical protein HDU96_001521 [Phlyctochytrium bullatum]|nr:hypothetical protein HDU96_001521 [Phlyctochytrium bullatum]
MATPAAAGGSKPEIPSNIKNIVLLCMENRSFDHYLGFWARTRSGVDGIPANATNVCSKTGAVVSPRPLAQFISRGPQQNINATARQIYGNGVNVLDPGSQAPTMAGFCDMTSDSWQTTDPAEIQKAFDAFRPEQVPVTATLAAEYAVFDRFFSSVPGPTIPNRAFLMSATANGMYANDIGEYIKGFPQPSVFGLLSKNNVGWKNYFSEYPSSILFSDVRVPDVITRLSTLDQFHKDAREGKLPAFSFLDPDFGSIPGGRANDNHPPADVARGERLIKEVYESLRASPQWEQSMLIITYDEHGGFYDHVPPPINVPSPDAKSDASTVIKFTRLGVRVPTLVISPWIPKSTVVHAPPETSRPTPSSEYELSSIIATIRKMWGLKGEPLTRREAWAGTFEFLANALPAPRKDCVKVLPDAPPASEPDPTLEDDAEEWVDAIKGVFKKIFGL